MRHKRRIGIIAVGVLGNTLLVWGFDYVLYPYVINAYGLFKGTLVMMLASYVLCLATLKFYDWSEIDWLGIELIKELRDGNLPESKWLIARTFQRLLKVVLQRGDLAAFFALSILFDPFIATAFLRRGVGTHKMTYYDWQVFYNSILVSNVAWALAVFGVLEAVKAALGL